MANTNDDVIIVGSLSDEEMRKAIDDLVGYVGDQTTLMAGKFTKSIDMMRDAMKDFAVTQKVSVDLMKDAWRSMSQSFDAMVAAQSNATGNTGGSGKPQYADNTVGQLEEIIRLEEKRRKDMELGTQQLRDQNLLIEEQKKKLQSETTSDPTKNLRQFQKDFGAANSMSTKTLQQAEDKLKRLLDLQTRFKNQGLIDEAKANRLQSAIDNVRTKIDRLRQTSPKNISDVLGMNEDSVDAIAKKMAALKKLTIDPNNAAQVKQLGDEYQRLSRLQAELLGRNIQATHSNNMLAQSFGYIRNRIVYAMTLGAMTSFIKQVYEIRGQYELLERSLGVLVNSFEQGSRIFQELNAMAIESPFTLMELAGAAKQLTAYNFTAKEVVDTTRRLADISSALGVPMERLTYNLGQIRAQTVLTARDARDFANAGLPIVSALADRFTELEGKVVSTGDVYDRMSKKMVSYSDVMAVLNQMTDEGGKFFNFQAKQAETLRVQMANLSLAWNNMLNEIGEGNQTLISLPIKGLRALLQNWGDLNRVIKNLVLSFGLLKVAQMVAIRNNWALAASTGNTAKLMGTLANAVKGLGKAFAALFTNPWTLIFVGIAAITDLIGQYRAARKEIAELNEEIRDNATEASQSNINFLSNKGNKATRDAAKEGKLSAEQAAKAWESVEEHLNTTAASANALTAELWQIDDVNQRVAKGFDYAERIQKAQAALQDLESDTITVTQDAGWWGMFGEGLVSDMKDYMDDLREFEGDAEELNKLLFTDAGTNTDIKIHFKEFQKELSETSESISNFINAHNITDPLQINEILSRVKAQIKTRNPEIKGELGTLFDVSLDQQLFELTNGAVDKNASLWAIFMERLKHNSSATFQGITDEIYKESGKLTAEQQAAVDANLDYFKDTMPWYYNAVKDMVDDASKLKIQIGIAFGVQSLTDFQKQVQSRIAGKTGVLDFGSDALLPTQNDDLKSWVETQQKAIKGLQDQNKLYAKDQSQWSKDQQAANNREIQQRKNLLDLFNQSYEKEKKGRQRKDVDIVAEAIKQEISLIREMQSNYNKLRKAGVSDTEAIEMASRGYEMTLLRINNVLQKFGISKFNASDFAGKNVRQLLDSLTAQRDALLASGKVKTTSLKDLDVEIQKLTVEAKTYDMKMITDGLNSELGKLKDEYELAVELDANPELGNMFADMFGIDTSELPHTFGEAVQRAQKIINDKLKELNINSPFDLMRTQIESTGEDDQKKIGFAEAAGLDIDGGVVKGLLKWQKTFRDMFQKNLMDTEKALDDYVKKYGDYSDKIAEIERNRLEKMRQLNNAYYDEQRRNSPEYKAKEAAINNAAAREKSQAEWDEFQNTRLYITLFENLEYVSTSTLRTMKEKLDEVKGSMQNLKPEQLKQIMTQYQKIEKEMLSRNPFKGLIKNAKDYMKAVGKSGKQAQKDFAAAQKNYSAQLRVVTALKEQYEQKKSQTGIDSKQLEALAQQIGLEDEKLKRLKAVLDAAEKEVEKYNMMTKLFKEQADEISAVLQTIAANLQSMATLRDNLQDTFQFEFSAEINGAIDGLSRMGSGISGVVSSAKNGDIFGIVNGVVDVFAGIGDGIASIFGDGSARTKKINKEIEKSVETVRQLNMAYKQLDATVNNAMGAQELQARREQIQNKQQQVEELKRQMQLEQSKRSKDRDDDKIKQYQETIQDLELEIADLKKEVVANLLGEDVKSAAEAFVSTWVDAWRQGGDTMGALNDKFDDMIDNMIAKSVASYLVSKRLQRIFDAVDEATSETSEGGAEITMNELKRLKSIIGDKSIAEQINEDLTNLYNALGIAYGVNGETESNLSALQQGIQSITEDTAGAIEAYLNIVSQKMFEQNDVMVQIRDTLFGFDLDTQLAVQSQMLLQLQNSYQTQEAIRTILEGWSNANGMAVKVEIV